MMLSPAETGTTGKVVLEVKDLAKSFGGVHAVRGASFEVREGEILGLIGPNGSGKSTLFNCILGQLAPTRGDVKVDGRSVTGLRPSELNRLGIGRTFQLLQVFPKLTVRENLILAARSGKIDAARLEWIFSLFPAMQRFFDFAAGTLSGGQKQMLAISRALIEPRDLILVDEPTKGLAPAIVANMIKAFREVKNAGATVLLVEQNFMAAKMLGDLVAVMDDGRIVHRGSMAELAADHALQHRLLGLHMDVH